MTNIPTVNRFVLYTLTALDADTVNRRRADAEKQRIEIGDYHDGVVVHVGNTAEAGQTFPMLIVRVWGDAEDSAVNGQVFLDGNDTLWKTSVQAGEGAGAWVWPVRR
ncbi:hypothetical protein [Amycolatopsis dendrobii]|uniref:Uncharacterized protein n=1 Tax=Amycolatopsis dendrobii TaxID=2760662 RepID=A0A7W3ZA41_9PSEU|nr:hypothetical protein [Amycolatopsis dendrobii]MBB1153507.1 hypothetical protein [Amycolatopsis dendrobii]